MLEGLQKPVRVEVGCKVMKIAAGLDGKDSELFLKYVADDDWVAESLASALAERGVIIRPNSIRLHRKNQCMCSRLNNVG